MHDTVIDFVSAYIRVNRERLHRFDVLDLGSCDRNGTFREAFKDAKSYTGLDASAGPGVDIVADARIWEPDRKYDLVLCTSVLEHVEHPRLIIATAAKALRSGGAFLLTTHTPAMHRHGMTGDDSKLDEEFYHNFESGELEEMFADYDWISVNPMFGGIDYFISAVRK